MSGGGQARAALADAEKTPGHVVFCVVFLFCSPGFPQHASLQAGQEVGTQPSTVCHYQKGSLLTDVLRAFRAHKAAKH